MKIGGHRSGKVVTAVLSDILNDSDKGVFFIFLVLFGFINKSKKEPLGDTPVI